MAYAREEIFARQRALIGDVGMEKLAKSSIAICGLGGVGSYLAEALARCAIGHLLLIDFDRVDVSNINRQLCALHSTVGQYKADIVAERIADINPDCRVEIAKIFLEPDSNLAQLLSGIDYLADAIDHVPAKLSLIEYAYHRDLPLISAMGAGRRLNPHCLQVADISATHGCPLARIIRKQLRERGIRRGVKVVFSAEQPLPVTEGNLGSMAFVPSVAGLLMAAEIVNDILQRQEGDHGPI
jgi:tRNA A37 threonylcarbamoyladenosine dehydratase